MEFRRFPFFLAALFLTGYYTGNTVGIPVLVPAVAAGTAAVALGRKREGMVLLCAGAFLLGSRCAQGPGGGAREGSLPPGIWELRVETATTSGLLVREASCGTLWLPGNHLSASCSRGDSLRVMGRADGGFLEVCALESRPSSRPHDVLRRALSDAVSRRIPSRTAGALASALLTGDRGRVPRQVRELFRATGTSHLLALSGLHVGIVAAAVLLSMRRFLGSGIASVAITVVVCGAYAIVSGARPSTMRAWLMLSFVMVLWRVSGRKPQILMAWTVSLVLLTLFSGGSILDDPGAQMSFAAVLALILAGAPSSSSGGGWGLKALQAGVVVTVALAPLVSAVYGGFNPVAPLATALSIPFMLALMVLGGLSALLPVFTGVHLAAEWTAWLWLSLLGLLRTGELVFSPWMFWLWLPGIFLLWVLARRRRAILRFR